MTFRDLLALDIATFLDVDEFGELVSIALDRCEPVDLTAVRDDDLTIERTKGPPQPALDDSIQARRTVLHFAAGLLDRRPVEGERPLVTMAGESLRWYVRQVSEAEGMIELTLERQET